MAAAWTQAEHPTDRHKAPPAPEPIRFVQPQRRSTNPPPVCFNCGVEGHFVVNCPQPSKSAPVGVGVLQPSNPTPHPHYPTFVAPAQSYQHQPGPGQVQFSSYPQNTQYGPTPPQQHMYTQPQQQYQGLTAINSYSPFTPPAWQHPLPAPAPQAHGTGQIGTQPYHGPPQQFGAQVPGAFQAPSGPHPALNPPYHGLAPSSQPPHQQWHRPVVQPHHRPPRRSASFPVSQNAYPRNVSNPAQQNLNQRSPIHVSHVSNHPSQVSDLGTNSIRKGQQTQSLNTISAKASIDHTRTAIDIVTLKTNQTTHGYVTQLSAVTNSEKQFSPPPTTIVQENPEDGEVTELDGKEEDWEWSYEHIFSELPLHETVALAQPLGASFKSTPVPLIQAWSSTTPSISRYARNDNVKDFVRSIRSSPQWPYVKADPAFDDTPLHGSLIPLAEVRAWTAVRRARFNNEIVEGEPDIRDTLVDSKKRSRNDEDEQEHNERPEADNQSQFEVDTVTDLDQPPHKRLKNEAHDGSDDVMQSAHGSMTPVLPLGRSGTPYLATDDDAWAPQPGERAASPGDPTEALLASLGVSGSPQHEKSEPLPPRTGRSDDISAHQKSNQERALAQASPTLLSSGKNTDGPHESQFVAVQERSQDAQKVDPPITLHPQNGITSINDQIVSESYAPDTIKYAIAHNQPHKNGSISQVFNGPRNLQPPFGSSFQTTPPANTTYVQSQHAPVHQPHYGPPVTQPHNHYPPNNIGLHQSAQFAPNHSIYGNTSQHSSPQGFPQYGAPQPTQYITQQYGPHMSISYTQGPPVNSFQSSHVQHGHHHQAFAGGPPVPGPYVHQQYSPVQYGPPLNQHYPNQYSNQPFSNGSNAALNRIPTVSNNVAYQTGPPNQGSFSNHASHMPSRQDSGYGSAGGSYSGATGTEDPSNQSAGQILGQPRQLGGQSAPRQPPQFDIDNQGNSQFRDQHSGSGNQNTNHKQQHLNNFIPQPTQNGQDESRPRPQESGSDNRASALQSHQVPLLEHENGDHYQLQRMDGIGNMQKLSNHTYQEQDGPQHEDNDHKDSDDAGDSPLSPTSAEILGKLAGKPNSIRTDSSRRKEEARKRKPQPVVEAAYNRRW